MQIPAHAYPINEYADMAAADAYNELGGPPPDPLALVTPLVLSIVTASTPWVCRGGSWVPRF